MVPPDVVRMRASSTVLVKASRRVKRDLAGIVKEQERPTPGKMDAVVLLLRQIGRVLRF